jgi:hypothetical protein
VGVCRQCGEKHFKPDVLKRMDFVESLEKATGPRVPRRSLKGLWADLDVNISADDIAAMRREMWGGFPREDI